MHTGPKKGVIWTYKCFALCKCMSNCMIFVRILPLTQQITKLSIPFLGDFRLEDFLLTSLKWCHFVSLCLIIAYWRDCEPIAVISLDFEIILEFHFISAYWPNVQCLCTLNGPKGCPHASSTTCHPSSTAWHMGVEVNYMYFHCLIKLVLCIIIMFHQWTDI